MNKFQTTMYNDLVSLCSVNEAFYYRDCTQNGHTYRVFTYRLASYSDFMAPNALECRSSMFEIDSNQNAISLVSLGLPKFFNKGENPLTMNLDFFNPMQIMLKMDGSLIQTFLEDDTLFLKSKTSLESDQAVSATNWLKSNSELYYTLQMVAACNYTVSLEWTSPENRIVIGYDQAQLTILAIRDNITGDFISKSKICKDFPLLEKYWVETYNYDGMDDFVNSIPDIKEKIEGFVIQLATGQFVKIKTLAYLALHHTKDSVNCPRRLYECVLEETSDDLRSLFSDDPSALKLISDMEEKVDKLYNHLVSSVEHYYDNNKDLIRKDYAIKGQKKLDNKAFSLAMLKYVGKEFSYKDFMKKNWKEYGIKDSEASQSE